jgi:hypothetical protein
MNCGDNCPDNNATIQLTTRSRSEAYNVEEIDFAWSARKGWSSRTETGHKGAASGAAYYVNHELSGAFQFGHQVFSVTTLEYDNVFLLQYIRVCVSLAQTPSMSPNLIMNYVFGQQTGQTGNFRHLKCINL